MQPILDFFGDIGRMIYNPDIHTSRREAEQAEQALLGSLQQTARDHPGFADTMKKMGFLNPDNTLNVNKMKDQNFLGRLREQMAEQQGQLQRQFTRQTATQNALTGVAGSGGVANRGALAQAQRAALREYADQYRGESQRAMDRAQGLGTQLAGAEQRDFMTRADLRNQAKQRAFQGRAERAAAERENKGILQDPNKSAEIGGRIIRGFLGGG